MSRSLPVGDYRWLSREELDNFDLEKISFDSEKGFAFEVTLEYPKSLAILHNSFPLAPVHYAPSEEELSPYAKDCLRELNMKYTKVNKLCGTFHRRENYVCHGKNLALYLELGMRLVKIHSGVEFTQGDYMKRFVDNCALKRKNAVTEMDSMIYKRIINSVFGSNFLLFHLNVIIFTFVLIHL